MENRRRSRNSSGDRKKGSGNKVRIKKLVCSKCKATLYDPKTEEINYVLTSSWDVKVSEVGFSLEPIEKESMQCTNCGRKIPLDIVEEKLGHEAVMLLREKVKTSA